MGGFFFEFRRMDLSSKPQRLICIYALMIYLTACKPGDVYQPEIKLSGEAQMLIYRNEKFEDPGAIGTDFDGRKQTRDISSDIVIIGEVDTASAGQYTLYYRLKDQAGNAAEEKRRTVIVRHKPAQFTGRFQVSENCGGISTLYHLTVDSVLSSNKLRVSNFGNTGSAGVFTLSGSFNDEIFLESQSLGAKTYAGSGNIRSDGKEISMSYHSSDADTSIPCSCLLRRQ